MLAGKYRSAGLFPLGWFCTLGMRGDFSCFQSLVDKLMFYPLKVSHKERIQKLSVQIPSLGEPFSHFRLPRIHTRSAPGIGLSPYRA